MGRRKKQETVVVRWNKAALEAVRNSPIGPPMVARALAILHTCIYDAWAAYDPVAVTTILGTLLRRPPEERTEANKMRAISYAAHAALIDLFPDQSAQFDRLMQELDFDPTDHHEVGSLAANVLLHQRHGDGSNQLGDLHPGAYSDYTGYSPRNTPDQISDPNRWQPLRLPNGQVQSCLAPHWGLVRPFALVSGSQFRPAGPRTLPRHAEEQRQQCLEVLHYSAALTDHEKVIAEYWADGPRSETPPGHWCLFAQYISRRDRHGLDQDVKLFFILTNALLDASICCWDTKRTYDSARPVTVIHHLFRGKRITAWRGPNLGTGSIRGEEWQPYQAADFVTPPFPEFTSGHSTFSAAAAEVLKRFTGSDLFGYAYTQQKQTSRIEAGVPAANVTLRWATFSEAADQAGLSRRYGGIHFAEADLVGRTMGRLVGDRVWRRALSYIDGWPA